MDLINRAEKKLRETSPWKVVGATAAGIVAAQQLHKTFRDGSLRQRLESLALCVPAVQVEYRKEIMKGVFDSRESHQKAWAQFGDAITAIPKDGWSVEGIKALILANKAKRTDG